MMVARNGACALASVAVISDGKLPISHLAMTEVTWRDNGLTERQAEAVTSQVSWRELC